jgi:hypothetical protein
VEEYATSALDDIMGQLNDTIGGDISAAFLGDNANTVDTGPSVDVIGLLFALVISKVGLFFSIGINWGSFGSAFGWLNRISVLLPVVPHVSVNDVKTVTFIFVLCVQPATYLRMKWLQKEHGQHHGSPWSNYLQWLSYFFRTELKPYPTMFSPIILLGWLLFWIIFIATMIANNHIGAGLSFVFIGFPIAYLQTINFYRQQTWRYVFLRSAEVVRIRQYEIHCLQEGNLLLFLYVASYTFVLNFFLALLSTWSSQTGVGNAFLVLGFISYSLFPLQFLVKLITDINADRTFRLFRDQLVSSFVDQQMYMKIYLLIESGLFAMLVLLGSNGLGQLVGGFLISVVFFLLTLYTQPYEDDMENYSDIIGRITVILTAFLGAVIQMTGESQGISIILILISCATTLWFFYTLDLKEMFLNRIFLLLLLYAETKASRYTKAVIRGLASEQVKHIANSPIEFHVLSAVQRIHFATLRKDVFFSGNRIKELADLGITWLDLQQMGCTVTSLRNLGFTMEELMKIDKQLDDMGDRSDIQRLYKDFYQQKLAKLGYEHRETLAAMHDLGALYKDMGEHIQALEKLEHCFNARKSLLGVDDNDTLVSQQFIGEYFTMLNQPGDGVELLQTCYTRRAENSPESEETLDSMRALGKCLLKVGLTSKYDYNLYEC